MAMPSPQAETQTYTLHAHITALAAQPMHANEFKNFEATITFEAADEWEAEEVAAEIQESFYGQDGEQVAGLDPQEWVIYDVLGIEVRDAADCLLVNLDRYGNWQRTGGTIIARTKEPTLDLPDWRDEEIDREFGITNEDWQRFLRKGAYGYRYEEDDELRPDELDYAWGGGWTSGYTWGLAHNAEAIAAQIVAYCRERGYDIILKA